MLGSGSAPAGEPRYDKSARRARAARLPEQSRLHRWTGRIAAKDGESRIDARVQHADVYRALCWAYARPNRGRWRLPTGQAAHVDGGPTRY